MFAIIKTGGKQYKVSKDDTIVVNLMNAEEGDIVAFEDVVLLNDGGKTQLGAPGIKGVTVAGRVIEHARGEKVIAFKKRRRQNSRRKRGHRQELSVVQITEILTDGKKPDLTAAKPVKKPAKSAETTSAFHGEEDMKKPKAKKATTTRKTASKTAVKRKTAVKKPAAKKTGVAVKKAAKKTTTTRKPAKKTTTKRKTAAKKPAAKKATAKRATAKRGPAKKKTSSRKTTAKKAAK